LQFRERFRQILFINETPHRIAIAFAIGIFIGMSPLLGVHTILGLAVAWQFKLNKFVTLIGVYVTNPWTIVPIYTFGTWLGARLMGLGHIIPDINWSKTTFLGFIEQFRHLVLPFIVGSTVLGTIAAIAGYTIILHAVKKSRA
jgi:uncharacterized protein (DUF2062 family)